MTNGKEKDFLRCGENMIERIIPHVENASRTRSGDPKIRYQLVIMKRRVKYDRKYEIMERKR
jgi:hypothetical protein